jgi:transglutaminase-like putative cysteine protease
MKPHLLIIALITGLLAPFELLSQKRPVVAREAAWVTVTNYDHSSTGLDNEAEDGYIDLVYEEQVSIQEQSLYCRRATKILTEAGIQNSSQVSVDFDPMYQQLIFHSVRIIRDGQVLNKLNLSKIKTIEREKELDRFMYDGSLSSILFLEDVRKGDIIEYAYTIKGFNPVFKDKYAHDFSLNFTVPVYNMYYKLIVPVGRTVNLRNNKTEIKPVINSYPDATTYEWRITNVNALHVPDNIPSWYDPYSSISASEYSSWKEVNDWAMDLFRMPETISPDLQKKIGQIKINHSSREEQILEALRFVQDDIRYMGIEMGPGSHKPNSPNKVFAQRFGDCKDKSYLLCTILRSLGIEANPVLINTDLKGSVANYLPSPKLFDHTTVTVRVDDRTYWLDPTISYQRGGVSSIYFPGYECGLVISDKTTGLTKIPTSRNDRVEVREVFDISDMSGPSKFSVITHYSGRFADNMRNDLNSSSRFELLKSFRDYYAGYYNDIKGDSLDYTDDEKTGIITTKEYYTIRNIWQIKDSEKKATFNPYVIDGNIKRPKQSSRTMPFSIGEPAHYVEEVEINLPEDWSGEESMQRLRNDGFAMKAKFSHDDRKFLLQYDYEVLKDHVTPEELKQFMADVSSEQALGYELTQSDGARPSLLSAKKQNRSNDYDGSGKWLAGVIAAIFLTGLIWRISRR